MKVDLPTFLIGLFLFISALGMVTYLVFGLLFDDTNYDDYPIENLVFGFGLLILVISWIFYMGIYFISISPIENKGSQSFSDVGRK